MPTTTITTGGVSPNTASSTRIRKNGGIDMNISTKRISATSTQPE